jgi:hypothetical protein
MQHPIQFSARVSVRDSTLRNSRRTPTPKPNPKMQNEPKSGDVPRKHMQHTHTIPARRLTLSKSCEFLEISVSWHATTPPQMRCNIRFNFRPVVSVRDSTLETPTRRQPKMRNEPKSGDAPCNTCNIPAQSRAAVLRFSKSCDFLEITVSWHATTPPQMRHDATSDSIFGPRFGPRFNPAKLPPNANPKIAK